jgi:ubiquinone/menaquinone biosynthesis C-methylase UbiE
MEFRLKLSNRCCYLVARQGGCHASCDSMNFDSLAPHYRWMEFVLAGEKLQRCRTAFLDRISAPENMLIWGEGNGRFLVECCRKWRDARIVCADASEGMLALANERVERFGLDATRIEFLRADVLNWSPLRKAFDLVVTHFFLDCFRTDQLQQIIDKLAFAARPNVSWILADFQIPHVGLQKWRARLILKVMYIFFRVVTRLPARQLISPDPYLTNKEFFLRERRVSEWGLLHSDWWQREMR